MLARLNLYVEFQVNNFFFEKLDETISQYLW